MTQWAIMNTFEINKNIESFSKKKKKSKSYQRNKEPPSGHFRT